MDDISDYDIVGYLCFRNPATDMQYLNEVSTDSKRNFQEKFLKLFYFFLFLPVFFVSLKLCGFNLYHINYFNFASFSSSLFCFLVSSSVESKYFQTWHLYFITSLLPFFIFYFAPYYKLCLLFSAMLFNCLHLLLSILGVRAFKKSMYFYFFV